MEAKNIFEKILINYNYEISIYFEKEFNINRYEYFGFAWNLDANKYIKQNKKLKHILALLSTKYKLAVVTDAPKIWAEKVLIRLDIIKMFRENIFTGESNIRKSFGNAFLAIAKHLGVSVSECVVVGDDKQNDIDFAKEIGMKTIYIGDEPYEQSDYSIKDVCEIDKIFGALT